MSGGSPSKTQRACANCQKAHLNCNNARPCERCKKRGLGGLCHDGRKKRAKYLVDAGEGQDDKTSESQLILEASQSNLPKSLSIHGEHRSGRDLARASSSRGSIENASTEASGLLDGKPDVLPLSDAQDLLQCTYDLGFESDFVNSEYSMLSDILAELGGASSTQCDGSLMPLQNSIDWLQPVLSSSMSQLPLSESFAAGKRSLQLPTINHQTDTHQPTEKDIQETSPETGRSTPLQQSAVQLVQGSGPMPSGTEGAHDTEPERIDREMAESVLVTDRNGNDPHQTTRNKIKQQSIYDAIKHPYHYTEGYHALLTHLKARFPKDEILRIVRALALYRPSLIALQMPLTEEDETFVEKCFQRTLIEFEKLVMLGGTPTLVWRRTCEICLVGKEFTLLTGWTQNELLDKKTYIYELMTTASAVQYWEDFASHAFENTAPSVTKACMLLNRTGTQIPCAFCFTIKRDIFDIPNLCIGNFLPILT